MNFINMNMFFTTMLNYKYKLFYEKYKIQMIMLGIKQHSTLVSLKYNIYLFWKLVTKIHQIKNEFIQYIFYEAICHIHFKNTKLNNRIKYLVGNINYISIDMLVKIFHNRIPYKYTHLYNTIPNENLRHTISESDLNYKINKRKNIMFNKYQLYIKGGKLRPEILSILYEEITPSFVFLYYIACLPKCILWKILCYTRENMYVLS